MKKILLPIAFGLFSFNVLADSINKNFTIQNNNLFKHDSVISQKELTLSSKEVGNFSSYYLNNGIKIILLPFPNTEKMGVYFTARVGSKNEGYGETGMAHLLEHMLFKSSTNFKDIKKELTSLGATWNAFTNPEQTTFHEVFNNDQNNNKLEKVLQLEGERFFEATFTKEDLDKEMTVVRNELERNASSASTLLWNETVNKTFDWYGYKHPTIGEKSDIENAPFNQLQNFYNKYYQPKNTFLVIFGNFKKEEIKPLIEKHLGKYKNTDNAKLNNWTQEPFTPKNSITNLYTTDSINSSIISWKAPNFIYDPRNISAKLLFTSITQQPYGALYKKYIANKHRPEQFKHIIGIETNTSPFNDYTPFLMSIDQGVENNKNPMKIIEPIVQEVESLKYFNKENFEQIKKEMKASYKLTEVEPEALVSNFIHYEVIGDWSLYFHKKQLIENANFEDGINYLKEYISPYNRNIINMQKDPNLKDKKIYNTIKHINESNYHNKLIDSLNKLQEQQYNFHFETVAPFEPTLENLQKKTEYITIKDKDINIKGALVKKDTPGNYIYFSLKNSYGNEELNTKFKRSCGFLEAVPAFEGKNYSKEELDKIMVKLGAQYSLTFSSISLKVKKENLTESLNTLVDVLQNPAYNETEFENFKKALISSLEEKLSDPNIKNSDLIKKIITPYDNKHILHPLNTQESLELAKKAKISTLKTCFNTFKGASESYFSIVGNISKDEVIKLLQDSKYTSWKSSHKFEIINDSKIKPYENILKEHNKSTFILENSDKPNSYNIRLAQLPIKTDDPDYVKVKTAINIFGEGSNSRIFKALRENGGLSYTANATLTGNHFFRKSPISMFVISSVQNADKTNELINKTWEEFLNTGITENELATVKDNMLANKKLLLSDDSNIVGFNLEAGLNEHDIQFFIDYYDKVQKLTLEEVNSAIKKYLENIKFIVVYNK